MFIGNINRIDYKVRFLIKSRRTEVADLIKFLFVFCFFFLLPRLVRVKIMRHFPHNLKLDIYIKKGAHSTEEEINKQINDRERIAAAIENQNLWKLVEDCIKDDD